MSSGQAKCLSADLAIRDGTLDCTDNNISDRSIATEGTAKPAEDANACCAGVIGNDKVSFVLNHTLFSLLDDFD